MKTRNGFVSNSSSSSFIIAWKKKNEDVKKLLEKAFAIPKFHPLSDITEKVVNCLCSQLNENTFYTEDDYLNYIAEEGEYKEKEILKFIREGFTVGIGSLSDEEYGIEAMLCNTDLNYKSDDLVIIHEGGY